MLVDVCEATKKSVSIIKIPLANDYQRNSLRLVRIIIINFNSSEKIMKEKDINKVMDKIVDELQKEAMAFESYVYEVKATHQIIRKHIKALTLNGVVVNEAVCEHDYRYWKEDEGGDWYCIECEKTSEVELVCDRVNNFSNNRCINCGAKAGHPCQLQNN